MQNSINLLNIVALTALMLDTGLRVDVGDLAALTGKRVEILLGVVASYLVVPAVACILLHACGANPLVAAGFLVLSVCPGAPVGPPLTELARGNLALSVGLMLALAGLSALLSPLLLMFLLPAIIPTASIRIDYVAIVRVLVIAQLLPLAVGLVVKQRAPLMAPKLANPLGKLAKGLFAVVLVVVTTSQISAFAAVRLTGWLGMLALLSVSLASGWFCGGKDPAARKALALTTAMRNASVGLVIALANFAGTPATAAVVVYSVFSAAGCLVLALFWRKMHSSFRIVRSDEARPSAL